MEKCPNIVIFNPDQFRADALGHMGNPAASTPNLDSICLRDGVSFKNAFCQNPVCTPSRCSFMTGWYPHVRGHRTMHHMLHADEPMLLRTLKQEGYSVWWGGKNDVVSNELPKTEYCSVYHKPGCELKANLHGGDQNWRGAKDSAGYYSFYAGKLDPGEEKVYYDSDWDNIYGALDFIRNSPKEQPFCVYLPLLYPHPPYAVEEPWYSLINRSKLPPRIPAPENWDGKPSILKGIHELQHLQSWSEQQWSELRATYYGMCSRVDHQFGLLVNALKEVGIYEDTAIFVFSDHGDFTGDYGIVEKTQNTFEDVLIRVPFIIKPPLWAKVKPRISDAMVELIDFPATVEALIGITPSHTHFGHSLLPVIAGDTEEHRDAVFCEGGRLHGETHCMELQSTYFQEPGSLYWPRLKWQKEEGPEHTKAVMIRTKDYKYVRRFYEKDELYDLHRDPQEEINCIDTPSLNEIIFKMKERLLDFYLETCDIVPHKNDER